MNISQHHPDCDGWRMHSIRAERTDCGTYIPVCPLGCDLHVIGSAGSPETAIALAREHSKSEPCQGECQAWT